MKKQNNHTALRVIGGLALTAAAMFAAPLLLERLSDFFNTPAKTQETDDDWGPEIVRRENPKN